MSVNKGMSDLEKGSDAKDYFYFNGEENPDLLASIVQPRVSY